METNREDAHIFLLGNSHKFGICGTCTCVYMDMPYMHESMVYTYMFVCFVIILFAPS